MLNIRPFYSKDYKNLLPFLRKFDPNTSDDSWRKLLTYEWDNEAGYQGMVMESGEEIVGFLSYILIDKKINDTEFTFCNLSSWVVNNQYRSKSMQLLAAAFKLKNVVILNLSPHDNTLAIFKALRFETLSEFEYRINPFKVMLAPSKNSSILPVSFKEITIQSETQQPLKPEVKKLLSDHARYENIHFYEFTFGSKPSENQLILAFNQKKMVVHGFKNKLKELPYFFSGRTYQFELFYCSNHQLLGEYFDEVIKKFTKKTNYRSVNISEHFLNRININPKFGVKNKKDCSWFYYSEHPIAITDIDLLYSEKVLLNF